MSTNRRLTVLDTEILSERDAQAKSKINSRVVGQDRAKEVAIELVARANNPLRDMRRPIGVVMFVGKSRTGKTHLAQTIAEHLHGDPEALVRVNCSNYKEKHHGSRLIGAPPGYVGYDDPKERKAGTDLSAKLSRANLVASRKGSKVPVTVVLLDEVDEVHEDLDNVLLSIMDTGQLDMGNNEVVDFRDCIIIMTCNRGMMEAEASRRCKIGFVRGEDKPLLHEEISSYVHKALQKRYQPQWLNRLDEIVIFSSLTQKEIRSIVDVEVQRFAERMDEQLPQGMYFGLEVEESAREFLLSKALANNGDVANLRRAFQSYLSDELGRLLASGQIPNGAVVVVQYREGNSKLTFSIAEGEQVESGADREGTHRVQRHQETATTREGRALQRKIDRSKQKARNLVERDEFDIILRANSKRELEQQAAQLMHDLRQVYGMEVASVSTTLKAPFMFVAVVEGDRSQVDALLSAYTRAPEDAPDLTIRDHASKAR